jgi:predicted nucleic acid-binding protein
MRLFDSNIVIALASCDDNAVNRLVLEDSYAVSVVTRIEVLGYHLLTQEDKSDLVTFLAGGLELALDDEVVQLAVLLRQQRRIGLGDVIIAATALVHKLPLVTRNIDDFKHVENLELFDPFAAST